MDTHSQPGDRSTRPTIDSFLRASPENAQAVPRELWGFGGLHGGLALAAMTAAMRPAASPTATTPATSAATSPAAASSAASTPATQRLRSVTGRLHRAVRDPFLVVSRTDAATRSTTAASARIVAAADEHTAADGSGSSPLASATALFGADGPAGGPTILPTPPPVPTWREGTLFNPPPSLVPVSEYYELRVTGTNRPFAGGTEARLTAWVRLTEDELPPDELRLLFLVDALAPSYAALLSAPQAIPTVELSAHFSGERAVSQWVLVDAATTVATPDGWITETINVWGEDGSHLIEARQLRLVRPAQPA